MPLIKPFQRRRCPLCFRAFEMRDCAIVSARIIDESTGSFRELKTAPHGLRRYVASFYTPNLTSRWFVQNLAVWRCPHCLNLLPANFISTRTYVLGVVGGRAAGKSHYIAALLQALLHNPYRPQLGIREVLAATSGVSDQFRNEYDETFLSRHERLDPTLSVEVNQQLRPLIYTVVLSASEYAAESVFNLVVFDCAGEDFTNEQVLAGKLPFLPYLDGLILLVDPCMMSGAKQRLPLHMQQAYDPGSPAVNVLESIIRVLRRYRNPNGVEDLAIPLVVTIAKSDLLKYILPHLGQHELRFDADYSAGFDETAFKRRSDQIRDICMTYDGSRLLELAQAFRPHAFSAVTATGRAADESNHFSRPSIPLYPQHCLDPLLWLLRYHQKAQSNITSIPL